MAVREQRLFALPTLARDATGQWPDEQGLLVVGIPRDLAVELARRFQQNAILVGRAGESVELLWLGRESHG